MQRAFGEALLGDTPEAALQWVCNDDGLARDRLFVYRRNVQSSLLECLRRRFARVAEILGEAEFEAVALDFVREHPPADEALLSYGTGFPEFLQGRESGALRPWLASLAKLELCWHECFHERDAPSVTAAALSEVDATNLSAIRFELHPTLRALPSDYQLLEAWEEPSRAPVKVACLILVIREGYSPRLYCLQGVVRTLFEALASGVQVADAFALAPSEAEFSQSLAQLVSMGVFSCVVL